MIARIPLKTLKKLANERIVIKDIPNGVREFLAMPEGIEKNYRYSKLPHKEFECVSLMKQNGDVFFNTTLFKLMKVKKAYFLKAKNRNGLSFKDGKLSLWFGANINAIHHLDELCKCMGWEFVLNDKCEDFITKSILQKLFKDKITNARDLLRDYAKSVRLVVSPELLYNSVKNHGLSKNYFNFYGGMAENVDHFLEVWNTRSESTKSAYSHKNAHVAKFHQIDDLIRQYQILDKKINFRWSDKRIANEHLEATKVLMDFEVGQLSSEEIEYPKLALTENFEILNSQKRAYIEGKTMKHCIYTNYWKTIKTGKYLALHVKLNEEIATLGLNVDKDNKLKFNQLYGVRNSTVSKEMKALCDEFLKNNSEFKMPNFGTVKPDIIEDVLDIRPVRAIADNNFWDF